MKQLKIVLTLVIFVIIILRGVISHAGSLSFSDYFSSFNSEYFSINRYFFVWDNTNYGSPLVQSNIVMAPLLYTYYFFTVHLNIADWLVIFFAILYYLISGFTLLKLFIKSSNLALIGSLPLIFSPFFIAYMSFGWPIISLIPIGSSFLLFFFFIKYLEDGRKKYLLISALFSIPTFFLIQYGIIIFFLLFVYAVTKIKYIKYFVYISLLSIALNVWWLVPFAYLNITAGYTHYTQENVSQENKTPVLVSYLTLFGGGQVKPGYTKSLKYQFSDISQVASFLYVSLVFYLAIDAYLKKQNNSKYLLIILVILMTFSFGHASIIYGLFYKYLPFFFVFRSVDKFFPYIALVSAVIVISSIKYSKQQKIKVLAIFCLVIQLSNSWPLLTGNFGGVLKTINLPNYYNEYFEYENANLKNGRGLVLPIPYLLSMFSFSNDYQLVNPIRTHSVSNIIYDEYFGNNLTPLQKRLIENVTNTECNLESLLYFFNIDYLLIQNDQIINPIGIGTHYELFGNNANKYDTIFSEKLPSFSRLEFGDLVLFKKNSVSNNSITVSETIKPIENTDDIINKVCNEKYDHNQENTTYVSHSDANQYFLNTLVSDAKIQNIQEINPTQYTFTLSNIGGDQMIVLDQRYDKGWIITNEWGEQLPAIHLESNGYSNLWVIRYSDLEKAGINSENSLNLVAKYQPQNVVESSIQFSIVVFGIVLGFLVHQVLTDPKRK